MEFNQPHSSNISLCRPFFFRFVFIVHPNETSVLLFCRSEEGRTKCLCIKSFFLFFFYFFFLNWQIKKNKKNATVLLLQQLFQQHIFIPNLFHFANGVKLFYKLKTKSTRYVCKTVIYSFLKNLKASYFLILAIARSAEESILIQH